MEFFFFVYYFTKASNILTIGICSIVYLQAFIENSKSSEKEKNYLKKVKINEYTRSFSS